LPKKLGKKIIFVGVLKVTDEKSRIRSWNRTKMSRIRNIGWSLAIKHAVQ
jgi:hypothetical protein